MFSWGLERDRWHEMGYILKLVNNIKTICDALRGFRPFLQFKKREKHPWRSVTFKSNTLLWVFFMFFELNKCYQIAQWTSFLRGN